MVTKSVLCVIDNIDIHFDCYTNGDNAHKAAEVILDKEADWQGYSGHEALCYITNCQCSRSYIAEAADW